MQKLTAMFKILVDIFWRGGCTISKSRNTQTRLSTTTRYRHGDRGARGSSGICPANGPGGCRIFTNYCSVRVCAGANLRPPNLDTTSGEEIPCPDLRNPFPMDFPILEIVITNIRLYMQCTQILLYYSRILYRSRSMPYIGIP